MLKLTDVLSRHLGEPRRFFSCTPLLAFLVLAATPACAQTPAPAPAASRPSTTPSTWNVLGEAVAGPLEGQTLTPLVHHDTFWFVWSAFRGDAGLYEAADAR